MGQVVTLEAMGDGEELTVEDIHERIGGRIGGIQEDMIELRKAKLVEYVGKRGSWKVWRRC